MKPQVSFVVIIFATISNTYFTFFPSFSSLDSSFRLWWSLISAWTPWLDPPCCWSAPVYPTPGTCLSLLIPLLIYVLISFIMLSIIMLSVTDLLGATGSWGRIGCTHYSKTPVCRLQYFRHQRGLHGLRQATISALLCFTSLPGKHIWFISSSLLLWLQFNSSTLLCAVGRKLPEVHTRKDPWAPERWQWRRAPSKSIIEGGLVIAEPWEWPGYCCRTTPRLSSGALWTLSLPMLSSRMSTLIKCYALSVVFM